MSDDVMKNFSVNNSNRYLIAIGSPYCPKIGLDNLENVERDVDKISQIFKSQGYERVLADQIEIGEDSQNIKKALSTWFSSPERRVSDCVIVYYAGHGDEYGQFGSHYLLTVESSKNKWSTTAIETSSLAKCFFEGCVNTPANILLILDVCYAGAGAKDMSRVLSQLKGVSPQGSGFWIMSSANANTEAGDGAFVEALTAVMDPNSDLFQGSQDFVPIESLVAAINSHLELNQSMQTVIFSCSEGSAQSVFIRNPHNILNKFLPDCESLFTILRQIDSELINAVYRQSYPDHLEITFPQTLEEKIDILVKLPKGVKQNLSQFIASLIKKSNIDLKLKQELEYWGNQNLELFNLFLSNFETAYFKKSEFFLMIQIDKHKQEPGKYSIVASLIEDPDPYNKDGEWISTTLLINHAKNPEFELDDIPEVILNLVDNCVCDKGVALTDLTIHCFVPIDLLHHDVEQKVKIPIEDDHISLGTRCNVVMRSLERQKKNGNYKFIHPDWKKQWDELLKRLGLLSKEVLLLDKDKLDNFYSDSELLNSSKIGCVFVGKCADLEDHTVLFRKIFRTAQPIALWLRPNHTIEQPYTAINSILDCVIEDLPSQLTRIRLTQDELAKYVALLWDNPYRPFPEDDWKGRSE